MEKFSNKIGQDAELPQPLSLSQLAQAKAGHAHLSYLEGLNDEQTKAVLTTQGPVLVLAGAGTGKTRVLTSRIAHILSSNLAWPSQILAVTFTNKAAREMKGRISNLVGSAVEGMPWLGTFHSIGVKILRHHGELVGLRSHFTILDNDDVIRLLKQIIQAQGLDDKRWPARTLAHVIDGWKNRGLMPDNLSTADCHAFAEGQGQILYQTYQNRLKTLNACDFGDLLLYPIQIFRSNPGMLADYHRRFRYILVDEYQDTNVAQYLWLRLLAQRPKGEPINLCCVGDDDQSIYGWRGAEVDNILRFEKDFPNATVIRLERNYRSTTPILATASHLIAHNEGRLGKTLFTDQPDDDAPKVQLQAVWDCGEEARAVGEMIERWQGKGQALSDMAILVRASFQMRSFEERFVSLGLNYRIIGGPRFYERLEIRDALAYLRLVAQASDDLAFERIINTPKRGLGEATLRLIHDASRARAIPLLAVAAELVKTDTLKPKVRSILTQFVENFRRWQDQIDKIAHTELAEMILEESGYNAMWQNDRSAEAAGRLENLKELIRSMEEFESLRAFLEHVSLVMEVERGENLDAVSIMTLHSAKGLEFDTVFLPGWEDGLFPHQRSLDEGGRSGLEEERRLAYVGLTRAKKNLTILFAANRRVHGQWQNTIPSRFLDELPPAHVEIITTESHFGGYGRAAFAPQDPFDNNYQTPGWQRARAERGEATRNHWGTHSGVRAEKIFYGEAEYYGTGGRGDKVIEGKITAKSSSRRAHPFSLGERIFHSKFGYGNITHIDGDKLTVNFDKAGEKRVLDSFVEKQNSSG